MSKVFFLFCIHNHQPVGNFEHVFSQAYQKCYSPLLETLLSFPKIRFSIHHSGSLLEWIEKNKPEYIKKLRRLVKSGRVEIMGGGFYEPILSILPERDAVGQLEMMNEWAEKNLGQRPRGAWLSERVWDPALPRILSGAGLEYTLLDDTHFHYAGLSKDDMYGYYVTERHGFTTAIFPIDKNLRYAIPFQQPEKLLSYFRGLVKKFGTTCATYGDDGEKFGLWPNTFDWVYIRKWLARFFKMVEKNQDLVETITYSEYLDRFPAKGRIYLPMASYEEMMHWTLPTATAREHTKIVKELKDTNRTEEFKPFLRGGLWDNFLVKYEESNLLHKRMLYTSQRVGKALAKTKSKKLKERMQRELYRGQCNCPYWHGLFGGLYLSNLRHAVYRSLINSSKTADTVLHKNRHWVEINREDFFKHKRKEIVVETKDLFVLIDPFYGGTVAEIDFKPASFNISNVLTRRPEEYHEKIRNAKNKRGKGRNKILSIHNRVILKEKGLDRKLIFDQYLRRSFLDHFIGYVPDADAFRKSSVMEKGDFANQPYSTLSASKKGTGAQVELVRVAHLNLAGRKVPVQVKKRFKIDSKKPEIICEYFIKNNGGQTLDFVFGVEWNFTLLAANDPDRYITINNERYTMNSKGETEGLNQWAMTDEYFHLAVGFSTAEPVTLVRFPIETVSQSEEGFELTYQGTAFIAIEQLSIKPGHTAKRKFSLTLQSI